LADMLRHTGHTVTSVSGGEGALAEFRPGAFDAVLCDLGMAGLNGWELAERVRALDREVAILFVTGWGLREEELSRVEALRIGRCLYKPVLPAELDEAVREATGGA